MAFHEQFPAVEEGPEEVLVDTEANAGKDAFAAQSAEGFVSADALEAANAAVQERIIDSKAARFEHDAILGAEAHLAHIAEKRAEVDALLATMGGAEQAEYKIAQLKLSEEKINEIVGDTDAWYAKLLKKGKVKSFDEIMNKVHTAFKNSPRNRVNVTDKPTVG